MKPPRTVKLGGQTWKVREVDFDSDLSLHGRTSVRQMRIELDTKQHRDQSRDTLLHEILHAIASNIPGFDGADEEEKIIRLLTPWLLAALTDNPELVAYLTS